MIDCQARVVLSEAGDRNRMCSPGTVSQSVSAQLGFHDQMPTNNRI